MTYERIIQWVSGPFSIAVGGVATKLIAAHGALLSSFGLSVKGTAQAIAGVVVFLVSAGVTYAGHHKWLTNAAKWWEHSGLTLPSALESASTPSTTGNSGTSGGAPVALLSPNAADQLRAQLREAGITPEA